MSEEIVELNYSATFSKQEFDKMSYGYKPEVMEDKWFIYMKDNKLSLHRSWTGHCIYTIDFIEKEDSYSVNKLIVNCNAEQYKQTDNEYDIELAHFLVNNILLHKNIPFSQPSTQPKMYLTGYINIIFQVQHIQRNNL